MSIIQDTSFYRANVTNKDQAAIESQYDDSAIRFFHFDGKRAGTGETKAIRANDLQQQGNTEPTVAIPANSNASPQPSNAQRLIPNSSSIGNHNDKYWTFAEPGKA